MTTNPQASDYTEGESQLVPGSLTVFRHFIVLHGSIYPMNYNPSRQMMGWTLPGHRAYKVPGYGERGEDKRVEPYRAVCAKPWTWNDPLRDMREGHDTPAVDCTCGFYASYDPETDFYPSYSWGTAYAVLAGCQEAKDLVVVRAVCEVSGKVVMGRLGVRAQRMRILGMAVDWTKQMKFQAPVTDVDGYVRARRDDGVFYYATNRTALDRMRYDAWDYGGDGDNDAYTESRVQATAREYGVRYWDSVKDMHAAHPMEDVVALGVDTTPPPEPDDLFDFSTVNLNTRRLAATQNQLNLYANAFRKAVSGFSLTITIADETAKKLADLPKPEPTPFERALLAKKNKPAPPGTGIDRRK